MKAARFLILVLIASLLPANAFAQTATTARVSGVVTDSQGGAVSGATVKLIDKATKAEKTDVTNNEGRYIFASVDPGIYDLSITVQGFRTTTVPDVKADITKVATVDVQLQPGGTSEQVTVTATGEVQLQKDDATVGNVIEGDRIQRWPQVNGQVTCWLWLQPALPPGSAVPGSRGGR